MLKKYKAGRINVADLNMENSTSAGRSGYVTVIGGMGFRAAFQAALTILLAHLLGPVDYGIYIVVSGIASFFSVLAGVGASALHLRDTSITPDAWRNSFAVRHATIWKTQPALFALAMLMVWLVVRGEVGWGTMLMLVFGELLGAPASDLLVRSYQGRERYLPMATAMCLAIDQISASRIRYHDARCCRPPGVESPQFFERRGNIGFRAGGCVGRQ